MTGYFSPMQVLPKKTWGIVDQYAACSKVSKYLRLSEVCHKYFHEVFVTCSIFKSEPMYQKVVEDKDLDSLPQTSETESFWPKDIGEILDDGNTVAVTLVGLELQVWQRGGNKPVRTFDAGIIYELTMSDEEDFIVFESQDGFFYQSLDGEKRCQFGIESSLNRTSYKTYIFGNVVTFMFMGPFRDNLLVQYVIKDGEPTLSVRESVPCFCQFDCEANRLITYSEKHKAFYVHDLNQHTQLRFCPLKSEYQRLYFYLQDGNLLVICLEKEDKCAFELWNWVTGEFLRTISQPEADQFQFGEGNELYFRRKVALEKTEDELWRFVFDKLS